MYYFSVKKMEMDASSKRISIIFSSALLILPFAAVVLTCKITIYIDIECMYMFLFSVVTMAVRST